MKKVIQVGIIFYLLLFIVTWNRAHNLSNELNKISNKIDKITDEINELEVSMDSVEDKVDRVKIRHNTINDIPIDTDEQIQEEIKLGEMELLAQLIEAEAGNQDLYGKRLVADVVINRSALWNMSIEETVFQQLNGVYMFSSVGDGNFNKAAWHISSESFEASRMEYEALNCTDRADAGTYVMYFRTDRFSDYGTPAFKHGDHYFSYGCNKIGE